MDRRKRTARTVALMSLFSMTDTQENVPVASFDGDGSDLISLIVGIEPVQAGSGDPSPDNVRPISGWTGANIHVSPTTDAADGTTYSITFPSSAGTVYGGTLDVTTGKLTVDRAMADMGTMTWTSFGNTTLYGGLFYSDNLLSVIKHDSNDETYCICSMFGSVPNALNGWIGQSNEMPNNTVRVRTTDGRLYVRADSHIEETVADFKTAMSGVQLVYELATPIVYDLTPTEINTLIGTNNIWADTGEIKYIEYNV